MSHSWVNRDWYFQTISQTTKAITNYICSPQSPDSDQFLIKHLIPDLEHLLSLSTELENDYCNEPYGNIREIDFFIEFHDKLNALITYVRGCATNGLQQLLNQKVQECKEFLIEQTNRYTAISAPQTSTN